jgi:dTDP-4-amino-4,6-dideoxygalactose transaminase
MARPDPIANPGRIAHGSPCLGPEEEAAALGVLRSGRLAPGPEAARLEALVARLAGGADAVALASGTLALTLALRALGIRAGERVAIPAYACAALLHAVRDAGAEPLLCDIEPRGLAIDPEDLARRDGPARAVVLVHPFGMPARPEPFRSRGFLVIEDCAQAIGAADRNLPVGARGDAAVFSFGPTKLITCGGHGGALSSPSATLVRTARDLAGHDEKETDRRRVNGLLGDLHAAIACRQVDRLRAFLARRAAIAARYDAAFAGLPVTRPPGAPDTRPAFGRYLLRVPDVAPILATLNAAGIEARRPVHRPLHVLTGTAGRYPITDEAHATLVSLPVHPSLTDTDVERVIQGVLRCPWRR